MDNLWPFMLLTGVCCVVPVGAFTMGIMVGRKGSPLHIKLGWGGKKSREPHTESEAFRWEEAS